MASAYPGALDSLPANMQDDTDAASGSDLGLSTSVGHHATQHNNLADAVNKIEAELGINPSGTFADVLARLNARLTCRKSADQAFATATLANVTDLSFAVAASQDYYFKFAVMFTSTTTTSGLALAVTIPASPTAFSYAVSFTSLTGNVATNIQGSAAASAGKVQTASATAAATAYMAIVEGILSNGVNAGTLQLQASEGGGTVASQTIKKGSYGELYLN